MRVSRSDIDKSPSSVAKPSLWNRAMVAKKSVANVTAADIREFLALAVEMGIEPAVEEYALAEANRALMDLKRGGLRGAKVLMVG